MYEFKLYSQVEAARHDQVCQILAGVTAMQPVTIREQTLIYQQLKQIGTANSKKTGAKPQQQVQKLSYHKLVRDLDSDNNAASEWRLRIEDVPEAGVKNVISQPVSERALSKDELERFKDGSEWYR